MVFSFFLLFKYLSTVKWLFPNNNILIVFIIFVFGGSHKVLRTFKHYWNSWFFCERDNDQVLTDELVCFWIKDDLVKDV